MYLLIFKYFLTQKNKILDHIKSESNLFNKFFENMDFIGFYENKDSMMNMDFVLDFIDNNNSSNESLQFSNFFSIFKDCRYYSISQLVQTIFEISIISIFLINGGKKIQKETFEKIHFYNIDVCVYQFCMFLAKLTINFFVFPKLLFYVCFQFIMFVLMAVLSYSSTI